MTYRICSMLLSLAMLGCADHHVLVDDESAGRELPIGATAVATFEGTRYAGAATATEVGGVTTFAFTGYEMVGGNIAGSRSFHVTQDFVAGGWTGMSYRHFDVREDWFISSPDFNPGTAQLGERWLKVRGLTFDFAETGTFTATLHVADVVGDREVFTFEVYGIFENTCLVVDENGLTRFAAPSEEGTGCALTQ